MPTRSNSYNPHETVLRMQPLSPPSGNRSPPAPPRRSVSLDRHTYHGRPQRPPRTQRRERSLSPEPISPKAPRSARDRLAEYQETIGKPKNHRPGPVDVDPEAADLVQYLALQVYHLPGNTWMQDWNQYLANNHPVLGIFCHHPLHPIGACTRVLALVGTLVFGLVLTNMFYLFYLANPQFDKEVLTVIVGDDEEWTLTTGMLLLWTLGGGIHTAYNLLIWHIAACACCRTGGFCHKVACCPSFGKHLLRVLVALIISMAVLIVLMRVAITNNTAEESSDFSSENATNVTTTESNGSSSKKISFFNNEEWDLNDVHDKKEFQFLLGYLVEMALTLFVYYPVGGTILFSGILGCGRIPILGGRPYEVQAEERRKQRDVASSPSGMTREISYDVEACPVEHLQYDGNGREMELHP